MTFPLIMQAFGQLSVVSPLANLVILPLVPLAMTVGFIAGLAGMIIPAFCGWLAWPAMMLAGGMLWVINRLSSLPFASLQQTFSGPEAVMAYLLLLAFTLALYRRGRQGPDPELLV